MGISFYDFKNLHHETFRQRVLERFKNIVDTGSFVEGEFNKKFETEFAKLQGAKHCLLVANGTDALEISLVASGVGVGDRVGVPGITFYATAEAVLNIGAIPVFIDVDYNTGLICPESFKRVSEKYVLKAVMPVHIYGLPCDMEAINKIASDKKIPVIEDAAQAQGALVHTGPVGSSGNLTTFSFYPTKNLSAMGDAGCILTDSDELAKKIDVIRNHGRGDENALGRNSRCDHMQAAVLHLKLEEISHNNQLREEVAEKYFEALKDLPIGLLAKKYIRSSSWHLYPIQLDDKEKASGLLIHLQAKGIGCTSFYERALSQEPPLVEYDGEKTEAEKRAGRTVCLPMHPFLTDDDINTIASEVKSFLS
ncbi:MAG: erythromycin biosynthesis sensory transduction protein eryC1 [Halobacteriovorax sp.]|nr:erythromycin biosynthesis sensory transduction protein eryC1 [Halobacteriovorax sp.]|tara:strand:+ start:96537 stop:97634 length:1098 start_codon:yes stop_codon:yes gene_type:complete